MVMLTTKLFRQWRASVKQRKIMRNELTEEYPLWDGDVFDNTQTNHRIKMDIEQFKRIKHATNLLKRGEHYKNRMEVSKIYGVSVRTVGRISQARNFKHYKELRNK